MIGPTAACIARPPAADSACWWAPALVAAERETVTATPDWALAVDQALASAVPSSWTTGSWTEAFALILAPLSDAAATRLTAELANIPGVDVATVRQEFLARLSRRLVKLATPVLVHELHQARDRGELVGADGSERFADFVRRCTEPERLTALFGTYSVLARLLAQECDRAVDTLVELLARFAADRDRLGASLLSGAGAGPVVAVRTRLGDPHRGGRSTSVVELAGGAQVVYKPRGVRAHLRFTELVGMVNEFVPGLELATVSAVDRQGYGWTEFVQSAPLADHGQAGTFHRRLGALLALLHVVQANDMHYGNLIANGDQPLVVDVETLFHPSLPEAAIADPALAALAESVARTGLLPAAAGLQGLTDISGMGGDHGQPTANDVVDWVDAGTDRMRPIRRPGRLPGAVNRAMLRGVPVDSADYAPAVLSGFRDAYSAIARHRAEFALALRKCAEDEVRVVVRHTRDYAAMLTASTRPELLRDALDRDRVLRGTGAVIPLLVEHEVADLWNGDIPLFTTSAQARDLWTATGTQLNGVLERSGLDGALATLEAMDEVDQRDQEWIISAALASRRPVVVHPGPAPAPAAVTGTAASADQLLAAACSIGDRVVAASIGRQRVNWIGLEPIDDIRWLVLPMGAGLANGYTGIALFLAQLSDISGVPRYIDIAQRSLSAIPTVLRDLGSRPDLIAAVGSGALHGFGGIAYALARLSVLLCDSEIEGWARTAVHLAGQAVALGEPPDWANGLAGCAAAMTAVDAELGCAQAQQLALRCVDELADTAPPDEPGFAEGIAGIRHAIALVTGDRTAAPMATPDSAGWCRGAAGMVLGAPDQNPSQVIAATTGQPALSDLSLCHGELGRTDVLASAADSGAVAAALRLRAGLVLDTLRRNGPRCATPDDLHTPSLLTGLSGIGYGLLRLGFPDRVPSVLLLEPTPAGGLG